MVASYSSTAGGNECKEQRYPYLIPKAIPPFPQEAMPNPKKDTPHLIFALEPLSLVACSYAMWDYKGAAAFLRNGGCSSCTSGVLSKCRKILAWLVMPLCMCCANALTETLNLSTARFEPQNLHLKFLRRRTLNNSPPNHPKLKPTNKPVSSPYIPL